MTPGADPRWRFLLTVSDRTWLEEERGNEGSLWLGDVWGRHQPVRADAPVTCLPLLKRPYATVKAELHETVTGSSEATRRALEELVPDAVIDVALRTPSSYWQAGAVAWLEAMDPSERAADQALRILRDPAADQSTRHAARRVHRRWAGPSPKR